MALSSASGGPKGFIHVVDDRTFAFADVTGNKQYITAGNLATDNRVALILVDYPMRARLKILGHAHALEGEAAQEWLAQNSLHRTPGNMERIFIVDIEAYDWNCPQHITPRYTEAEVEAALKPARDRIAKLEEENTALRQDIARLRSLAASAKVS